MSCRASVSDCFVVQVTKLTDFSRGVSKTLQLGIKEMVQKKKMVGYHALISHVLGKGIKIAAERRIQGVEFSEGSLTLPLQSVQNAVKRMGSRVTPVGTYVHYSRLASAAALGRCVQYSRNPR